MPHYFDPRLFKNFKVKLVRSNHAVIVLVHVKPSVMYVFFRENHAVLVSQVLRAILKELQQVFVSEVAKHPLDPNAIILVLKLKVLQPSEIEAIGINNWLELLFCLGRIYQCLGFLKQDRGRVEQVNLVEPGLKHKLCDATDACSTVQGSLVTHGLHEAVYHIARSLSVDLVHVSVAAEHSIDGSFLLLT